MVLIRFLKQQNWWLALPCFALLLFFQYASLHLNSGWALFSATSFLVLYSLKFAGKFNNQLIDQLKLGFYFLYFTAVVVLLNSYGYYAIKINLILSLPYFAFFMYFYSLVIFHKNEMEEKGKTIKKGLWLSIIIAQSILILGIAIWAITQKVEAEKQKVLALQNIKQGELQYQKIAMKYEEYAKKAELKYLKSKVELEELKQKIASEKSKTIDSKEK